MCMICYINPNNASLAVNRKENHIIFFKYEIQNYSNYIIMYFINLWAIAYMHSTWFLELHNIIVML